MYMSPDHKKNGGVVHRKHDFLLGCTSYVFPDEILPNVEQMAPVVDDIELVLFESDVSNLPDAQTILLLAKLGKQNSCGYTVHFPIDKQAGSPDPDIRMAFAQQVLSIINLTKPLDPNAYILHLEGISQNPSIDQITMWREACHETCKKIVDGYNGDISRIAVETLSYPANLLEEFVKTYGFSYCLDFGHLFLNGSDLGDICEKYLDKTRVVHLHGVKGGKDHVSLAGSENKIIEAARCHLQRFSGVVTLEVFNFNDTFTSLEVMDLLWQK